MDIGEIVFEKMIPSFIAIFMVLVVLGIIIFIIQGLFFEPMQAKDALNQCIKRGFDYAEKYNGIIFTNEATAVECGYKGWERKTVEIDGEQKEVLVIT